MLGDLRGGFVTFFLAGLLETGTSSIGPKSVSMQMSTEIWGGRGGGGGEGTFSFLKKWEPGLGEGSVSGSIDEKDVKVLK